MVCCPSFEGQSWLTIWNGANSYLALYHNKQVENSFSGYSALHQVHGKSIIKVLWVYIRASNIIALSSVGKWLAVYVVSMFIQTWIGKNLHFSLY